MSIILLFHKGQLFGRARGRCGYRALLFRPDGEEACSMPSGGECITFVWMLLSDVPSPAGTNGTLSPSVG